MAKESVSIIREEIVCISDMFYQNKKEEGIASMTQLIQLLSKEIMSRTESEQQALIPVLQDVLNAMEAQEYIMLADILVYEILPYFD